MHVGHKHSFACPYFECLNTPSMNSIIQISRILWIHQESHVPSISSVGSSEITLVSIHDCFCILQTLGVVIRDRCTPFSIYGLSLEFKGLLVITFRVANASICHHYFFMGWNCPFRSNKASPVYFYIYTFQNNI